VLRSGLVAVAVVGALLGSTVAASAVVDSGAAAGAPRGNVTPTLQPTQGVGVAAQSAPTDGRVALVLRNPTDEPVRIQLIRAVASRAESGFAARATSAAAFPQIVAPGGISLAAVSFRRTDLRPTDQMTFKVKSTQVSGARSARVVSVGDLVLSPMQTGAVAQTMTTSVTNPTSSWTAARPEAAVVCFGQAGNPSTFASARASTRRIKPGAGTTVTVPLTSLCPSYLVAARAT
jgi:hypothetical protein